MRIEDITKRKRASRHREVYDALDEELEALEEIELDFRNDTDF
jgi:stress-induced morphogen